MAIDGGGFSDGATDPDWGREEPPRGESGADGCKLIRQPASSPGCAVLLLPPIAQGTSPPSPPLSSSHPTHAAPEQDMVGNSTHIAAFREDSHNRAIVNSLEGSRS